MLQKTDPVDRVEVEVSVAEFDPSERARIRERILIRGSDFDGVDDSLVGIEGKLRRVYLIGTVLAVLFGAWIDGRFGFTAPNAVPVAPGPPSAILADADEQPAEGEGDELLTSEPEE